MEVGRKRRWTRPTYFLCSLKMQILNAQHLEDNIVTFVASLINTAVVVYARFHHYLSTENASQITYL